MSIESSRICDACQSTIDYRDYLPVRIAHWHAEPKMCADCARIMEALEAAERALQHGLESRK